jgi:hypothetical protein
MCTVSKKTKTATPPPQPVRTAYLPVVRCQVCEQTLAHQPVPGAAAGVLTAHYQKKHADTLAGTSA